MTHRDRPSRRLLATLAIAGLPLLLGGCASVPDAAPPELTVAVPSAWSAADGPPQTTDTPTPAPPTPDPWWHTFGDPRLNALVEEALAHNHDLAAAGQRIRAAEAQAKIAGADGLPRAEASADSSRRRQNFIGFPIPGSDRQVLSTTSTSHGVALNLSWEVDLWGRLAAREAAARRQVAASRADWAAARLSLTGQVAKAWFHLLESDAQVRLTEATAASRRLTEERIRRRYEKGLANPLDLRLAMTDRAAAEALLARQQQRLDAARRQLEVLAGRYPAGRLGPAGEPAVPPTQPGSPPLNPQLEAELARRLPAAPPTPPVGLPSELLLRRPDLIASELRLAAAGARVAEARANLYPRIALTGSAGRRSQDLDDLLDSDFSVWSLLGNLVQPIFQGGRLRAGVELSEAERLALLEGYRQAALGAFREVETALAAEAWLTDQAAALAETAEQSSAARRLAEDRYANGLADILTVLESQRRALDAHSRWLAVRNQALANRVDLHLALGGGFDPAEPPLPSPESRPADPAISAATTATAGD